MSLQARHRGARRVEAAASEGASQTGAVAASASSDSMAHLLGPLNESQRMRLELIVRASASAAVALPHAIALLVGNDQVKVDAIVAAINSNDALHDQWQRAWTRLRNSP